MMYVIRQWAEPGSVMGFITHGLAFIRKSISRRCVEVCPPACDLESLTRNLIQKTEISPDTAHDQSQAVPHIPLVHSAITVSVIMFKHYSFSIQWLCMFSSKNLTGTHESANSQSDRSREDSEARGQK